jgi:hypothetical protein
MSHISGYDVCVIANNILIILLFTAQIIFRARRNFLMKEYKEKGHSIGQIQSDVDQSMEVCVF